MTLVLERVELVLARHGDSERTQRVLHPDRTAVLGQHLRQPAIGHRAFIEVGAHQRHAARLQPGVHLGPREPPLGLLATEQAPRAVHRRVQRSLRLLAVDAFNDDRVIAHRAADEATLAGECRRCALAHHPQIPAAMVLPPRVIVVVVNHVGDFAADDAAHALDHPFASGIGVAPGELHRRDVTPSDLAVLVDHGGRHVHTVLAAGGLEVAGRAGVTEAAAAEVHADPDKARLVAQQVDIVVARSDGAELRHRLLPVRTHVGLAPRIGVVEQFMLDPLVVGASDAERDHVMHVLDDRANVAFDLAERRVEAHGHVAAADVEADAGDADLLLIGNHAADRLGIAQMPVSANHAGDRVADRHAIAHLRDRRLVVLTEDFQRAILVLRGLRLERDIGGNALRIARQLFLARGIAKQAPRRHRPLAGPVDLRIGVEPGLDGQSPGAFLVGIGSHLTLLHCTTSFRRPFRTPERPVSVATQAGWVCRQGGITRSNLPRMAYRGSFPALAAEGDPLPRYAGRLPWRYDSLIEYTPTAHVKARPRRTTGWPASR